MAFQKPSSWILNNLGFDNDLKIYQDKKMFNYSVDTILLGNFVFLGRVQHALEIGTNNAALSIFVAARKKSLHIDAVEIQKDAVTLANYNIQLNKMQEQIKVFHADFKDFALLHKQKQLKKYQQIFVNPPYYPLKNFNHTIPQSSLALATYEISLTLEEIVRFSRSIIEQKGYLTFVIPIERFIDLVCLLKKHNFMPKRVQFIYPRIKAKAKFVLLESRFQSGWGNHYLPNIYLHPEDPSRHEYLEEVQKLYKPQKAEK